MVRQEMDQTPLQRARRLLRHPRVTADEIGLVQIDDKAKPSLKRGVDVVDIHPEIAVALFQPQLV